MVVPFRFAGGFDFSEETGVIVDPDTGLMGAIDLGGDYVIEPRFERLLPRADSVYRSSVGRCYGFVDMRGEPIMAATFQAAGDFSEGLAYVKDTAACVKIVNKAGCIIAISSAPNLLRASEGLAPVSEEASLLFGYVDLNGATRIPFRFAFARPFSEGLAAVSIETGAKRPKVLTGYIDHTGSLVDIAGAIEAFSFSEGLAVYCIKGKGGVLCGVIDRQLQILVSPRFELIGTFRMGLAPAKEPKGKWGFIDKMGSWVLGPVYDDAEEFFGGLAEVRKGNRRMYVNGSGQEVWSECIE